MHKRTIMRYLFICLFMVIFGSNHLISQNAPSPMDVYKHLDYTLPELKIVDNKLLGCMDTIPLQEGYSPYLNFLFGSYVSSSYDARLSYSHELPISYSNLYNPTGYFTYKGFLVFVCGTPIEKWFVKTGKKKRFHEKISLAPHIVGGGDKIWYFYTKESEVISIIQGFEE